MKIALLLCVLAFTPLKDNYGVTVGGVDTRGSKDKAYITDKNGVTKGYITPKGSYDNYGRPIVQYPDVDAVLKQQQKEGR